MNPTLRDRLLRKLDTLSDERGYQVLDYVEFLESKYAEKAPSPLSLLQRFTEGVEDRLRSGGVAASTVVETMGLLNRAAGVLGGVAAAGMSVASDVATAGMSAAGDVAAGVQRIVTPTGAGAAGAAGGAPAGAPAGTPAVTPASTPGSAPASAPGTPVPPGTDGPRP
jgi:hypothetical protein